MFAQLFARWTRVIPALMLATTSITTAQDTGAILFGYTTLSTQGGIVSSPIRGSDGTFYFGVEVGSASASAPRGRLWALSSAGVAKWSPLYFSADEWIDGTPAIGRDGRILFGTWAGTFYALDADTGTEAWRYSADGFIAGSAAVAADGTIYFGTGGSTLQALNADGSEKWTYPMGDWVDSAPAVGPDGTVYVGSWDNFMYAIYPEGTLRWSAETGGDVVSSPAIGADGTVVFGSRDKSVYAVSAEGEALWSFATGDALEASPVIDATGVVYIGSTDGKFYAINPDGSQKWAYNVGQDIYSTAALRADGSIIFGAGDSRVYALNADGTLRWRTTMPDWVDASPLVAPDGFIYVGCMDKKFYKLQANVAPVASAWPRFRADERGQAVQYQGRGESSGRLINLSVRAVGGTDFETLIMGFVLAGSGSQSLLVRGIGPTLTSFDVEGVLADPSLFVFANGVADPIASNDNWFSAPNAATVITTAASVGAFALPTDSADAIVLTEFAIPPGSAAASFTAHVRGASAATGVVLADLFAAGGDITANLVNVSARAQVGVGDDIIIAGFTIADEARTVLVRGVGPTLARLGVEGPLPNPRLRIFDSAGNVLAENDDWSTAAAAALTAGVATEVWAFALDAGSADAVLLVTLPPGSYTAQISGLGATPTGVALVEVYAVEP